MATFTIDLKNFAEKATKKPGLVMKDVAFDVYIRVAYRTPVDTGRARGGWQMSASGVSGSQTGAMDPTPTGTPNPGWAGADPSVLGDNPQGAFIFNNVVYIIPLEYGHSQEKAPNGMVRITVAEFQQIVNAAVAKLP